MTATVVLLGLFAVTYALKAAGPLLLGGRELPGVVRRAADLLPGPLLAALVITATVASGTALVVDHRVVGVVAAAAALTLRAPFVVVVLVAAATTALARLLF